MSEFKEFWILVFPFLKTPGGNNQFEAYDYRIGAKESIHVIEYAAVEAKNERIKELEEKLRRCEHNLTELGHGYQQAIKVAVEREQKLQIAVEALEKYNPNNKDK